ncbi:hypothetical protein BH09ACT1_BH09ACT1_22210 [soil metagenome]
MSDTPQTPADDGQDSALDQQFLDGHTIEELSDYLDSDRTPRNESIESSPGAQNALAALSRLRHLAPRIIEAEAKAVKPKDESWIKRILDQIGIQAHAGRDIPFTADDERMRLSINEGAVRAIIREIGDELDSLIVERCRLEGDVDQSDAPVTVFVEVSVFEDADSESAIAELRENIRVALERHTELTIAEITIQVRRTDLDEDDA